MHQNQIEQAAVLACQGGSFHPLYWKLSQVEVMERILIYSTCVCVCVQTESNSPALYNNTIRCTKVEWTRFVLEQRAHTDVMVWNARGGKYRRVIGYEGSDFAPSLSG